MSVCHLGARDGVTIFIKYNNAAINAVTCKGLLNDSVVAAEVTCRVSGTKMEGATASPTRASGNLNVPRNIINTLGCHTRGRPSRVPE